MFYNAQGEYINKKKRVEFFTETTDTTKTSDSEPKSCDNLIKQSYIDFDKQYATLKTDYDSKLKDQKDITEKTLKQFLDEKDQWNKKFEEQKSQFEKSVEEEKKKLSDLKKVFEEKINSLESAIKAISLDIKKI
jgi:hypothetical protein